jgi:hypothetical protein
MKSEIRAQDATVGLPEIPRPSEATRPADAGAAIVRFQAFMREHPIRADAIDIEALIEEGRS